MIVVQHGIEHGPRLLYALTHQELPRLLHASGL